MQVNFGDERFIPAGLDEANTIFPTHTCFDDAKDFLEVFIEKDPKNSRLYRIVHGICLFPVDQEPFAHAWVEQIESRIVFDGGIYRGEKIVIEYEKEHFYKFFQVQDCTKYTRDEWFKLNYASFSYGPWEKKYLALCKDKR